MKHRILIPRPDHGKYKHELFDHFPSTTVPDSYMVVCKCGCMGSVSWEVTPREPKTSTFPGAPARVVLTGALQLYDCPVVKMYLEDPVLDDICEFLIEKSGDLEDARSQ